MNARDVRSMAESLGIEVVSLVRNRHWKATLRKGTQTRNMTFPTSESEYRALKNKTAQLRNLFPGVE